MKAEFITVATANKMVGSTDFTTYATGKFVQVASYLKSLGMAEEDAKIKAKELMNQAIDIMTESR